MKPHLEYTREPLAPAFMLRALHPSPGLPVAGALAPVGATWRRHRVDPAACERLARVTGLPMDRGGWLLYPQVFGFRLQMVVVTHPDFPLPIWRGLAFRNHLVLHRPLPLGGIVDLETHLASYRVQEKGAELDVYTAVTSGADLLWEGVTTFYYRGRFGTAGPAAPLVSQPQVPSLTVAAWTTPVRGGLEFARFTGDYNGIHLFRPYARLLGFPRPFHHAQAVLGQSLARLTAPAAPYPHRLDAWLKGPVYYGSEVELRAATEPEGSAFALVPLRDGRPAIVGRWHACPEGSRLLDG